MTHSLTARNLFDDLHDRLSLYWAAGTGESKPYSISAGDLSARPDLAGFLNLIHPNKVQVLGEAEIRYLDSLHGVFMEVFTCA